MKNVSIIKFRIKKKSVWSQPKNKWKKLSFFSHFLLPTFDDDDDDDDDDNDNDDFIISIISISIICYIMCYIIST